MEGWGNGQRAGETGKVGVMPVEGWGDRGRVGSFGAGDQGAEITANLTSQGKKASKVEIDRPTWC